MSFQGKVIAKHNNLPLRMHVIPFSEGRVLERGLEIGDIVDIENYEKNKDGEWLCVYDRVSGQTGWVIKEFIQELSPPQPDAYPPPIDICGNFDFARIWQALFGGLAFLICVAIIYLVYQLM